MLKTSLTLGLFALAVGCAATSSQIDARRVGGTAFENRSKARLADLRVLTYRGETQENFYALAALEPYSGSHWWSRRPEELGRNTEFTWVDGRGQKRSQAIDIGDPRTYRGKTIVYAFDGETWAVETAPSDYTLPDLRPSK